MSTKAVFPDPLAPIIATKPGLSHRIGVLAQGAFCTATSSMICEGATHDGALGPTYARSGSMQACFSASKVGVPLTQHNRSSAGFPTVASSWASDPHMQIGRAHV